MTHLSTLVLLVLVSMLTACLVHAQCMRLVRVDKSPYCPLAPLHSMSESDCHTTYRVASASECNTLRFHVTISADSATRVPSHSRAVCKATSNRKPRKALPSRRLLFRVGAPLRIGLGF